MGVLRVFKLYQFQDYISSVRYKKLMIPTWPKMGAKTRPDSEKTARHQPKSSLLSTVDAYCSNDDKIKLKQLSILAYRGF